MTLAGPRMVEFFHLLALNVPFMEISRVAEPVGGPWSSWAEFWKRRGMNVGGISVVSGFGLSLLLRKDANSFTSSHVLIFSLRLHL